VKSEEKEEDARGTEKIEGKITVVTPLSYPRIPDENEQKDNVSTFTRMPVLLAGEKYEVPYLGGGAIRGRMRRLMRSDLLRLLGLDEGGGGGGGGGEGGGGKGRRRGEVPVKVVELLDGVVLKKDAKVTQDLGLQSEVRRLLPSMSLFGMSSTKTGMMSGRLDVGFAIPICFETNEMTGEKSGIRAGDLLHTIKSQGSRDSNKKIPYGIEVLIPGTVLKHYFILKNPTEMERKAFVKAVRLLTEHGFLGNGNARGMGMVKYSYDNLPKADTKDYDEHIRDNREAVLKLLEEMASS